MLIRQKNKHLLPPEEALIKIKIADTLALKETIPFSGHEKNNILCEKNKPHRPLEKILLCLNCSAKLRFTFTMNTRRKGRCPRCNAMITAETKPVKRKAADIRKHYVYMHEILANGGKEANKFIDEGASQYAKKYGVSHVETDYQDIVTGNHSILEAEFRGVFTINNEHKIRATIIFHEFTVNVEQHKWLTPIPANHNERQQIECAVRGFVSYGKCYRGTRQPTSRQIKSA